MKSSFSSRSIQLLGLAAKIGREEFAQTLKEKVTKGIDEIASGRLQTRIEQARLIAESLSQLKGAAMKAGQLLSLDANDYFPPEAIEILSKLQGKADPIDWQVLRKVMLEDLGEKRLGDFEAIAEIPAASASIGQVHRAKLGGRDVAIKIQYPLVKDSIDSDLRILRTLGQSLMSLTGRRIDLTELFEELSVVLKQEADYVRERENMQEFKRLLESRTDYIVPEAIESHSAERVLTMSWEEGLSVGDWLKTAPSLQEREKIGKMILDLYCLEFFEWGFVQTDPNYANFMIRPGRNGESTKLVVLDFGAALRYTPEFRKDYIELLKTLGTLDRTKIIRHFSSFGMLDERESDETKDLFAQFLMMSLEPFDQNRQPFKFRDDDYARRSREIGQKFTQSLKYSPPPRKILFLHRKLGGIFTLLKKLDVQLDLSPYWQQMVNSR